VARGDGQKLLEERGSDLLDRQARNLADRPRRTLVKWAVIFVVGILVLGGVGGCVAWVSSWGGEARRLTGPRHSEQQVTAVLRAWTGLEAAAGNACAAKNSPPDSRGPTLVEDPELAYSSKYREIKADYDRMMNNFFEAAVTRNLPIPAGLKGYPRRAPTLPVMKKKVC
jgi:hypothetical protein